MVNKQLLISDHHDDIRRSFCALLRVKKYISPHSLIWFTSRTFFVLFSATFVVVKNHHSGEWRYFESQRRRISTLEQTATAKEHIKNLLGREMKSDKFICFPSVHNGFGGGEWAREDLMSNFLVELATKQLSSNVSWFIQKNCVRKISFLSIFCSLSLVGRTSGPGTELLDSRIFSDFVLIFFHRTFRHLQQEAWADGERAEKLH